ncbi:MAG: ABC transporter permease [Actinomycetes bacterium]
MGLGGRLTLARLASQRIVLAAAAVTIVLATTLLTALWIYVDASATVGLRAAIVAAPESATGIGLRTITGDAAAVPAMDDQVHELLDTAFRGSGYEVVQRLQTDVTYTLPRRTDQGAADELTIFGWYADVAGHADLVSGTWAQRTDERGTSESGSAPGNQAQSTTGAPVEVALPATTAEILEVAVGDLFTVVQRLDEVPVEVRVVGTYEPVEPDGWYWRNDALDTTGLNPGATFSVRGPLLVADASTLASSVSTDGVAIEWHVGPRWDRLTPDALDPTRAAVAALVREPPSGLDAPFTAPVQVETELDEILPTAQRALISNRSMMIIPVLQLALLAGYTLLLAARLLSEDRRTETSLLRARGSSSRQLAALSLRETAMLVAPAVLLAPVAAVVLLRAVDGRGPFGELGGAVGTPRASWWLVAAAAAVLCGAALMVPTVRRSATYTESRTERGRQSRRGAIQRGGADLLLLGGAALAYWQLRHYESPVLDGGSVPRVDPLLVLGPCLALFAAAAVALRLLPHVADLAQRIASRRPSLGGALGAWQVSRRPSRYTGPALLLVLALAIGAMSTAYGASWRRSQGDQAAFQAGAELRVTSATNVGSVPALGQGAALAAMPSADAVAAVWRRSTSVGDSQVTLLAIDAAVAADVVLLRDDLAPDGVGSLMAPLLEARQALSGVPIPGEPSALSVTMTGAREAAIPYDEPVPLNAGSVVLTLGDARGSIFTTEATDVPFDGTARDVVFDLGGLAAGDVTGIGAAPSYPLRLVGGRITLPADSLLRANAENPVAADLVPLRASVVIGGMRADGAPVDLPDDLTWASELNLSDFLEPSGVVVSRPDGTINALQVTGGTPFSGFFQSEASVSFRPPAGSITLPVVLDRAAADAGAAGVGDNLSLAIAGNTFVAEVTGIVEAFSGTSSTDGAVLLDYQTLADTRWLSGGVTTTPSEWWLASSAPGVTAAALQAAPQLATEVVVHDQLVEQYQQDPLGATTLGALLAGFVAALGFAAVGFTLNLVIGARERLTELAVLRALGVSRRQVLGMLLVEQAFLIGISLGAGLLIGVAVSALVVPLVVLSPSALQVLPPVLLDVPWLTLGITAVATAVALGGLVVLAANRLQRGGLGSALRLGEDG